MSTFLFGKEAILSLMEPNKQYTLRDLTERARPFYQNISERQRYETVSKKLGRLRKQRLVTSNGNGVWTRIQEQ